MVSSVVLSEQSEPTAGSEVAEQPTGMSRVKS
jgi:hypothetical protein